MQPKKYAHILWDSKASLSIMVLHTLKFCVFFLNSTTHVKCSYSNKRRRTIGKLGKVVKVSFTLALETRSGGFTRVQTHRRGHTKQYSSL